MSNLPLKSYWSNEQWIPRTFHSRQSRQEQRYQMYLMLGLECDHPIMEAFYLRSCPLRLDVAPVLQLEFIERVKYLAVCYLKIKCDPNNWSFANGPGEHGFGIHTNSVTLEWIRFDNTLHIDIGLVKNPPYLKFIVRVQDNRTVLLELRRYDFVPGQRSDTLQKQHCAIQLETNLAALLAFAQTSTILNDKEYVNLTIEKYIEDNNSA